MSIHERFSEKELEILWERAARAASVSQESQAEDAVTALYVTLGNESYALPVQWLQAVYENVTVVGVPCTPRHVAGIANIRGRIMPVLNLAVLLNVPHTTDDVSDAMVVVSREDFGLVLRVEQAGEIVTFPVSSIQPLPGGAEVPGRMNYIQGVLANGPILLDINAIFNDPSLVVEDAVL